MIRTIMYVERDLITYTTAVKHFVDIFGGFTRVADDHVYVKQTVVVHGPTCTTEVIIVSVDTIRQAPKFVD